MDGFTFYNTISNNSNFKDIPFIFLTAKNKEDEKLDGLSMGAVDYIMKPFSIDELTAKIKSILKNRQAQKEINIHEFEIKISGMLREGTKNKIAFISDTYDLSFKEREVVKFLCKGLQYKEISEKIHISLAALRKRVHSVYKKLGVQNRAELLIAIEKLKNQ